MNNNLDLSEYGIFDGENIIPMNRKEKRKYIKNNKHNKMQQYVLNVITKQIK